MRSILEASCFTPSQIPPCGPPEILVAGRSNVGKSSLLNALLGVNLAHVGGTPGKTRSVNFYRVEGLWREPLRLVDLPGYGYASRSKSERNQWLRLISSYVTGRGALRLACHLVDFRHGLLANDWELQEWLGQQGAPIMVVFTKADKLPRGQWRGRVQQYVKEGLFSVDVPIVTSAEKHLGIEELRDFMAGFLEREEG